jgi:hypothetical protein
MHRQAPPLIEAGRRRALRLAAVLAAFALIALPRLAAACATCYGAADSPMVEGQNAGILTLLGFVVLVQLGVGKVIWDFRRRARRHARPQLRLIHGGKH